MANNPKHGDRIIERRPDPLGGEKLVASFQFQRFLDDLGALINQQTEDSQGDTDQQLAYLTALVEGLRGLVNAHIEEFSDLEQVVYDS